MQQAEEGLQKITTEVLHAKEALAAEPEDEELKSALVEKEIQLQSFRVKRNSGIDMHADPAR